MHLEQRSFCPINQGTFLGNCESDRNNIEISKKTTSLWSYLNHPDILTPLLNPMYEPNKSPIWPSVAPVSLKLWRELYLRWIINQSPSRKTAIKLHRLLRKGRELRSEAARMRTFLLNLLSVLNSINKKS